MLNIELYLISLMVAGAKGHWLIFAFAAALGQIIAKTVLFIIFRFGKKVLPAKYNDKIAVVKKYYDQFGSYDFILIFISAATSLPPFYLLTLFLGVVRSTLWSYIVFGFLGMLLRYSLIILSSGYIRGVLW